MQIRHRHTQRQKGHKQSHTATSFSNIQRRIERYRNQLERYEELCRKWGESPAEVALAWLLANPDVTAPIVGPRTMEQLEAGFHAAEIQLSDEQRANLDEIWPGPGGEAPEAYAW